MKKIVLVAAAAGLMTLAACTPKADNTGDVDNGANSIDAMGNLDDEMMGNDTLSNDTVDNVSDNAAM